MEVKNIWKGRKVQLRNLRPEDAELVMNLPMDTEANAFAGGFVELPRGSAEGLRTFFSHQAGRNNAEVGDCRLAIETLAEEKWVGTVGLHDTNMRVRSAELDVWISPAGEYGKGYGSEALLILLNYAFNELNLQRVGLGVNARNTRALALYHRLGFVEEGRLRRFYFYRGEYHDEIRMSLLSEEFLEQHRDFVEYLYSAH